MTFRLAPYSTPHAFLALQYLQKGAGSASHWLGIEDRRQTDFICKYRQKQRNREKNVEGFVPGFSFVEILYRCHQGLVAYGYRAVPGGRALLLIFWVYRYSGRLLKTHATFFLALNTVTDFCDFDSQDPLK